MKPAWYYQRQAQEAQARAQYFANRQPSEDTTVTQRSPGRDVFYRSMLIINNSEPAIFRTSVAQDTLGLIPPATAGLLLQLPQNAVAFPLRGSGVKPNLARFYKGATTPVAKRTAWNTRYISYADSSRGSHKSIHLSKTTGIITPAEIQEVFNSIFITGANRAALLGAENGRAYLRFESAPVSAQT